MSAMSDSDQIPQRNEMKRCATSGHSAARLFRPYEGDDAARHPLVRPIGVHSPWRQHLQSVTVHREGSGLLGADPLGNPRHLDLGSPLVPFNAISAGIGDE